MTTPHPFFTLRPEYELLLRTMMVTRVTEIKPAARRLLSYGDRYKRVAAQSRVPAVFIAALHERESGADFKTYLGNGEPLNKVTRLVPEGRGPFASWEEGAIDGLEYDEVAKLPSGVTAWDMPLACWKGELWNGFGSRGHGIHTPYLWSGTNQYTKGKYVADHKYDPNTIDKQLGIIPIMIAMMEMDPTMKFFSGDSIPPLPPPEPVGGNVVWLQTALNKLGYGPLAVDGSFGRRTLAAVRAFQTKSGLVADGLVGPLTLAALRAASTK